MRYLCIILAVLVPALAAARDSTYIRVHFIYGSRPLRAYQPMEPRWFGGIHGGHVGVQKDAGSIVSFMPQGRFHKVAHGGRRHSHFISQDSTAFYSLLPTARGIRTAIIRIPVSDEQRWLYDSTTDAYLEHTPYDYAFLGMRCAAAAADILGLVQVLPHRAHGTECLRTFYPKKLRKRLLRMARTHHWPVMRTAGGTGRKWERD